jgi:hypothetical protein
MKESIKQTAEAIASHPKTSAIIAASPFYSVINKLNPVMDFIATLLGIVLVAVLIRYHWQNTKKVMKDNENN